MRKLSSFEEFSPVYLRACRDRADRVMHPAALASGLAALVLLRVTASPWLLGVALVVSCGCALIGRRTSAENLPLAVTRSESHSARPRKFALWLLVKQAPRLPAADPRRA